MKLEAKLIFETMLSKFAPGDAVARLTTRSLHNCDCARFSTAKLLFTLPGRQAWESIYFGNAVQRSGALLYHIPARVAVVRSQSSVASYKGYQWRLTNSYYCPLSNCPLPTAHRPPTSDALDHALSPMPRCAASNVSQASTRMLSDKPLKLRWRLGILAALAITILSIYPQLDLWRDAPRDIRGPFVTLEFDEVAYSAYLNSLIEGRPRRNDPYTGLIDTPTSPQPETLFSIQFVPPYLLTMPARIFGLSGSTIFIALSPIVAFTSSLALFWLFGSLTKDDRVAAAGVLFVLCFGSFVGNRLAVRTILGLHNPFPYLSFLPFLRRYVPAVPFPFFLVFCVLTWLMLTNKTQRVANWSAVGAGMIFGVLVFSYFFLWTAAAAWLFSVGALWLIARPDNWRHTLRPLSIVSACALAALIPYALLLSHRAANMDTLQILRSFHAPDLRRLTEYLGAAVMLLLISAAWRGLVSWRDEAWLFAASFALLPFVVFNQQIVTGLSLQPGHYEKLITNYSVLIAFVLTATLWRGWKVSSTPVPTSLLIALSVLAFGWGLAETATQSNRNKSINSMRVEERQLAVRLIELDPSATKRPVASPPANNVVIFSPRLLRVHADSLPTDAPQPPFWAPHAFVFNSSWAQYKEHFYQNLYYMGVDERKMNLLVNDRSGYIKFILVAYQTQPITSDTIPREIQRYLDYTSSFNYEKAAQSKLGYLVTGVEDDINLSNLDRWYERNAGERVGELLLYRLKLRGPG